MESYCVSDFLVPMKKNNLLSKDEFCLFQEFFVEESGFWFEETKVDFLSTVLSERLRELKIDSYREYHNLLTSSFQGQVEKYKLFDLITIGETHFFRNNPQFNVLIDVVFPEIIKNKNNSPDKTIRIWSAGCSKGDEPYSIAIALIEHLPYYENWNISILATDINRNMLLAAQQGIYRKKDIAHLPAGYLDRYFEQRGSNYLLSKKIKNMVKFKYHNLAKDPFSLENMQNLDIIFCRNVTIYFDLQVTKRIINHFYGSLAENGYLFIGHAETLWQINDKFRIINLPDAFIYKKTLFPVAEEEIKPFVSVPHIELQTFDPFWKMRSEEKDLPEETKIEKQEDKPAKEEPEVKSGSDPLYQEATARFDEKQYEEALVLFDKIILQDKKHINAYFAKATILANQAKYEEAINELQKITETDNLYVEAYYLLGVLFYKTGALKEAETQFRKVIYIDHNIVLAYFNLGNIYIYQKRFSKAALEFNNVVKLLEPRQKTEQVRCGEDFTVDMLLRACKNNLTRMDKK